MRRAGSSERLILFRRDDRDAIRRGGKNVPAEGAGFEPARLLAYPLSRRAHSTTMRPLRDRMLCALGGNRTPDSGLRTPQLYPLSYEGTDTREAEGALHLQLHSRARRDLNPRPTGPQPVALSAELRAHPPSPARNRVRNSIRHTYDRSQDEFGA